MSSRGQSASPEGAPTEPSTNAQASQEAARLGRAYHATSNVNIIVDSCADFAPEVARALGVEVLEFPFVLSGVEHLDDLWQSMSPHEFYERMRKGEPASTSAITLGRYLEVFEGAAKKGTPTVYLAFTRGLSSSIDVARQAAQTVREAHPGFELYVVDNANPSSAAQLLAIEAVHQASNGLTAAELVKWAEEARYYLQGYFTLESFDALARGGRIPPAAAQVGGKLDIKPELSYDLAGALTLRGMCRGRKKALRAILADFKANYLQESGADGQLPVGIISADAEKDAHWLADQLRKEPGCQDAPIIFSSVGPVIGAHVGPGMVALVFWGKDRREGLSFTDRLARRVRGEQ
ncbi:DegV family protein [Thermophilibacter immobilis]|jgi:DegV family protein with EDD domain|uniref:DegV family protein n=1 Tax=Thermophilibacter immobilis TaxID=2779519 RepID=A0A7S7M9A4_9ACTN|nr:DegV family protein [Thermophilibacter immobilis]QOY61089.1 DegV family protein [Thermophilibacter immobilis]